MKTKHVIAIGFTVDKESNNVSGLSMMFELFCTIAKDAGYVVHIISLNSSKTNSKVGIVGYKRLFEYFKIIFLAIGFFFRFKGAILYFNPSTAKTGGYKDIFLINISRLFGCRILMQQFGALFDSYFSSLSKTMQTILGYSYNKAEIIIVEGDYAKQQYGFINKKDRIIVINNGLPEKNNIKQTNGKFFDSNDQFELFYMNNMIESKGYIDVLKAIDILRNEYKLNVYCTFAGRFMSVIDDELFASPDEAQNWFVQFISEKKLSDSISYYNCVFDKNKAKCFIRSNAFLLPSYYIFEGQPTAILEALSYGSVPIVTNYRLIPDMVTDSCGLFVNAKFPYEIADAVRFLMNNPDTYHKMSQQCIDVFNEKFTQKRYTEKIVKLLNEYF